MIPPRPHGGSRASWTASVVLGSGASWTTDGEGFFYCRYPEPKEGEAFQSLNLNQKVYYHHTNHIGGIKERTAKQILTGRFPERVVEKAVERMLPRGPLGRKQLGNLRVYPGAEHPHEAQKPETVDIAAMNRKNSRSA